MSNNFQDNTPSEKGPLAWTNDSYVNFYTLRKNVISEQVVEEMAKEIVIWARDKEDAFVICEFYLSKGIPKSTFYKLCKNFPVMRTALECVKEFIGMRREVGALKNKLNSSMVMSQQAKYDDSWWKLEERRADLKARSQSKHNPDVNYTIVMEDFGKKDGKSKVKCDREGSHIT